MLPFIDSKRSMACLLSAITLLKEFKELNENTEIMINNRKLGELNISSATVFLNTQILKMILQNTNVYAAAKIINKILVS